MSRAEASKPVLSQLPVRVDRKTGAALVTRFYFKVSHRSLERWPVAWQQVNGKAHTDTVDLFAVAEAMVAAAPIVMGGRRQPRALPGD